MGERRIEEKSVSSLNLSEKVNSIATPPSIPVVPDSGETFTKVGDVSSLGPPGGGPNAAHLKMIIGGINKRIFFKKVRDHKRSLYDK